MFLIFLFKLCIFCPKPLNAFRNTWKAFLNMARSFDNSNRPSKLTHSINDCCDFPTYKIQYWYTCSLSLHRCPSAPNPHLCQVSILHIWYHVVILFSRPVPAPDWAHAEKEEIPVGLSISGSFWPRKGQCDSQDSTASHSRRCVTVRWLPLGGAWQYGNPLLAECDCTATLSWRSVTVRQPHLGGVWLYGKPYRRDVTVRQST